MNNIVLQPKANQLACEHFADTMIKGVKKDAVYNLIGDHDQKYIESLNLGDKLRIWGVMDNNTSKFRKMGRGDLVLFTANNSIEAYGRVVYTFGCPVLARFLWGQDESGTWSNIYLIEDFHNAADIPVKALNKALGYQENNVIQGFTVINDRSRINSFLRDFDYSNGVLNIKDPKRNTSALSIISDLLQGKGGLTLSEIHDKTGIGKEELEPILKGGIAGRLFEFKSDRYHLYK